MAGMLNPVTAWDGEFLQFLPRLTAEAGQAAGTHQIFEGLAGYTPGFKMKVGSEFPFTPAILVVPEPTVAKNKKPKNIEV